MKKFAIAFVLLGLVGAVHAGDWVTEMRTVRQSYTDTDGPSVGTIGRFGDSISVSMASFNPLRWGHSNTTPASQAALSWMQGWMTSDCWDWQLDTECWLHGCQGSTTSAWPLESASGWAGYVSGERRVDYWLRNDNPEIAVIMWGTNDLHTSITPTQYYNNLLAVVQACKANGTIPILSTAPPRHNYDNGSASSQQRAADFHQAALNLAAAESLPLIEYHAECTTRNPHSPPTSSWDGADPMWSAYSGYNVPTSISGDGVHPSNPGTYGSNFSEEALTKNGFNLRNYMTLMASHDVYERVIVPEPTGLALLAAAGLALLRRRRRGA